MMEVQKKAIMPTLKEMKVGDVVTYPSSRLDTVRVSVGRLNTIRREYGHRWAMRTKGCVLEVERTA